MPPWLSSTKSVPQRVREQHANAALSPFQAPSLPASISFAPIELALSIGRNLALSGAPPAIINALANSALDGLDHFVDDAGADFCVTADASYLADAGLVSLAHNIGVGVAGLYMEAMGYLWRANGKELMAGGGYTPDYIWSTGAPSGNVVLSEAKGAAAVGATLGGLNGRARSGYRLQVDPWLGAPLPTGERIVWGYGIGVHAPGGGGYAGLAVHEPENVFGSISRRPFRPTYASNAILRSHLSSLFRAAGSASLASAFADGQLTELAPSVEFWVGRHAEREFLVMHEPMQDDEYRWLFGRVRLALELNAAKRYLHFLLSGQLRESGVLNCSKLAGRRLTETSIAVGRDGLAALGAADQWSAADWTRIVGDRP